MYNMAYAGHSYYSVLSLEINDIKYVILFCRFIKRHNVSSIYLWDMAIICTRNLHFLLTSTLYSKVKTTNNRF